jgi:hypothetical protein
MALVEKFVVVAAEQAVDPNTEDIKEGMFVAFTSAGVRRVESGDEKKAYGVAGDTKSSSASSMPGVYAGWQNRVSDSFDETKASGKLTVYHSGGEFATDQFSEVAGALDATQIGLFLKLTSGGVLTRDGVAKTDASVAQLTRIAGSYPSGVPGVDINGDLALKGDNTNQYVEFKLLI